MKSIYDEAVTKELENRVRSLTPATQALWGKMDVAQMMAHCNVPYEMAQVGPSTQEFKTATGIKRWVMKTFIKPFVVGEKPYKKNITTAPEFKIVDARDFDVEQSRLLENVATSYKNGRDYFEQRASPSFGPMTAEEWSNLFYKHLDHHLQQFGA